MTKTEKDEVLAHLDLPIGGDPSVCIKALVKIADAMMNALDKDRAQGALCLASAAAFIIDDQCAQWSAQEGQPQDHPATMEAYLANTMAAWNGFAVMFKGADPTGLLDDDEAVRPKGETLQ
jgi:hypothetical protein